MAVVAATEQETACWLALSRLKGVGTRSLMPLITRLQSGEAVWQASESLIREDLPPKKAEAFIDGRRDLEPMRLYESYANHRLGIRVLGWGDPEYPALLKETYNPPLAFYLRGNSDILQRRCLAVVGTRKFSDYGRQVTETLIGQLREAGLCIVSGLAAGIDALAHWAALENNLPTVAVLGTAIDCIYPRSNETLAGAILSQGGAILSEYGIGELTGKHSFPERNRIVAGMSHGTLMIEGGLKSGALITARLAMEENRTVFAVPGSIFRENAEGPLRLIREGAMPVTCGQDLLGDLGWSVTPAVSGKAALALLDGAASLSAEERQILEQIGAEPVSVERLQQQTGLSAADLNRHITMLELEGWVVALPGGQVRRKS